MADPLTILGAAASALQLGDAVATAAKRLYGFFWAMNHAKRDIEYLSSVLKDLTEVASYVRSFVVTFQSHGQANQEQEILPDIVISLTGCKHELDLLQSLVDKAVGAAERSRGSKLMGRISWVFDEEKTRGARLRLNEHKTSLIIALTVANGRMGLHTRGDVREVIENIRSQAGKLEQGQTNTMNGIDMLRAQMHILTTNHVGALENVKSDIEMQKAMLESHAREVNQHTQQELESITKLQNSIGQNGEEQKDLLGNIRNFQAIDREALDSLDKKSTQYFQSTTNSQMNILSKLNKLESQFASFSMDKRSIKAKSHIRDVDDDVFARILRRQLQGLLPDLVEECVSRASKESRGYVRDSMDNIPKAVDQAMNEAMVQFASKGQTSSSPDRNESSIEKCKWPIGFEDPSRHRNLSNHDNFMNADWTKTSRFSTVRRWRFRWKIGTLILSIRKSIIRSDLTRTNTFDAEFEFIPALWITNTGLIASYHHELDPRGYPSLCPKLSTFAIVPYGAEQFTLVLINNTRRLREMFIAGLASPRDRQEDGVSLLHHAMKCQSWATSIFLISQGADLQADIGHGNAMSTFYYFSASNIINLESRSRDRLRDNLNLIYQVYRMIKERGIDDAEFEEMKDPWISRWFASFPWLRINLLLKLSVDQQTNMVVFYKNLGVNFDSIDSHGWTCFTALTLYSTHNFLDSYFRTLHALLTCGYNINSRNTAGENAFHCILYGCIGHRSKFLWRKNIKKTKKNVCKLVELLWRHKCDLSARDSLGRTPTELAIALTKIFSLDIFGVWKEALQKLGIDSDQLLSKENSLLYISRASGAETGHNNKTKVGLRRRMGRSLENIVTSGDRFDTDELLCECLHCRIVSRGVNDYKLPHRKSILISDNKDTSLPAIYEWLLTNRNQNSSLVISKY